MSNIEYASRLFTSRRQLNLLSFGSALNHFVFLSNLITLPTFTTDIEISFYAIEILFNL